ncbi:MAG TPA: sigma-70 family RNA polymerase sigma factor, partial [Verrucomicrobiae bacterium]|nr:sigma-70 family RNA polymerase sigma factor [Verrucomicrobiae bacterium]
MRTIAATEPLDDVRLVQLSREGDREAFGRIVERYQSLICALTYSACGNFQASEDLAQVTFITAWCQLRQLREPSKLKSWLCSIARNATLDSFRKQRRTPTANAEALDSGVEISADAPTPSDHVISKEEEAILWRSLGELPTTYREPLVLFYRQQQSIAEVADALELSEDAVKQRLSRGRTMLTEKVTAFVEGALRQTTPGRGFTLGVLAALPVMATSTKAAVVGATAVGGAAKAAASIGIAGAILGPIIGILGGWFGAKMSIENTQSARERQFMIKVVWNTLALVGVFCLILFADILLTHFWWKTRPLLVVVAFVGTLLGYCAALMVLIFWGNRNQQRIRREEAAKLPPGTLPAGLRWSWPWSVSYQPLEYRSRWTFLGLPLIHVRLFCRQNGKILPAQGWIAVGDIAYGGLFAIGCMWAVAPISFGGGFAVGGLALGGGFAVGLLSLGGGISL